MIVASFSILGLVLQSLRQQIRTTLGTQSQLRFCGPDQSFDLGAGNHIPWVESTGEHQPAIAARAQANFGHLISQTKLIGIHMPIGCIWIGMACI